VSNDLDRTESHPESDDLSESGIPKAEPGAEPSDISRIRTTGTDLIAAHMEAPGDVQTKVYGSPSMGVTALPQMVPWRLHSREQTPEGVDFLAHWGAAALVAQLDDAGRNPSSPFYGRCLKHEEVSADLLLDPAVVAFADAYDLQASCDAQRAWSARQTWPLPDPGPVPAELQALNVLDMWEMFADSTRLLPLARPFILPQLRMSIGALWAVGVDIRDLAGKPFKYADHGMTVRAAVGRLGGPLGGPLGACTASDGGREDVERWLDGRRTPTTEQSWGVPFAMSVLVLSGRWLPLPTSAIPGWSEALLRETWGTGNRDFFNALLGISGQRINQTAFDAAVFPWLAGAQSWWHLISRASIAPWVAGAEHDAIFATSVPECVYGPGASIQRRREYLSDKWAAEQAESKRKALADAATAERDARRKAEQDAKDRERFATVRDSYRDAHALREALRRRFELGITDEAEHEAEVEFHMARLFPRIASQLGFSVPEPAPAPVKATPRKASPSAPGSGKRGRPAILGEDHIEFSVRIPNGDLKEFALALRREGISSRAEGVREAVRVWSALSASGRLDDLESTGEEDEDSVEYLAKLLGLDE
jgi:hypothetical protein